MEKQGYLVSTVLHVQYEGQSTQPLKVFTDLEEAYRFAMHQAIEESIFLSCGLTAKELSSIRKGGTLVAELGYHNEYDEPTTRCYEIDKVKMA